MIRTQLGFIFSLLISTSSLLAAALDKPFPYFEGKVRVPVGNHGATTVEVVGQNQLKTTDGYGPHTDEITLDLESGRIELTTIDYTPNETIKKTSLLPADQGGAFLPYRQQLQAMIGDLVWINQNLFYLSEADQQVRKPEMAAVLNYLNDLLAHEDAAAPESLVLNRLPRDLRRGISHNLSVEYLAHEERDLLVEVFDAQWRYLQGTRMRVAAGRKTVDVSLAIPADAPLDQPGFIAVKLIPVNGDWSDMLVEVKQSISFKKNQMITSASASWITFNDPRIAFYVNYYCPESCDVRLDIFDQQGKWLIEKVVPANAPYMPNGEQFTSIYVQAPAPLFTAGQVYNYYVKILPQGGKWDQYFDEIRGTFKAGK